MLVGRNFESKKVGNNTYAIRRDQNSIAIRLHNTDILTFSANGSIKLNTGGWETVTTKSRMNEFLPEGYSVFQKSHVWYVDTPKGMVAYRDNMVVFP